MAILAQRSVQKTLVLHLGQLDFVAGRDNIVLLGPPGTGKSHLAIALGIRACLAGHRVLFATATEWIARLSDAQRGARLAEELRRLERVPLLIVDLRRHRDYAEMLCAAAAMGLLAADFVVVSRARLSA